MGAVLLVPVLGFSRGRHSAARFSTSFFRALTRYDQGLVGIGVLTGRIWRLQSGISATGGTITTDGNYTVHTFTSSGTFTVTSGSGNVEYLVVGGGGGGGTGSAGGGGGAGEVRAQVPDSLSLRRHIRSRVGAGGAAKVQMGGIPYLVPLPQQVVARVVQQDLRRNKSVLMVVLVEGRRLLVAQPHMVVQGNTPSVSPHKGNNGAGNRSATEARTIW